MSWDELLQEGEKTVSLVRSGLNKRGFLTVDSVKTIYGTDEDIPIFNSKLEKIFWISVKTVYGQVENPKIIKFPGWMAGEIDSKHLFAHLLSFSHSKVLHFENVFLLTTV